MARAGTGCHNSKRAQLCTSNFRRPVARYLGIDLRTERIPDYRDVNIRVFCDRPLNREQQLLFRAGRITESSTLELAQMKRHEDTRPVVLAEPSNIRNIEPTNPRSDFSMKCPVDGETLVMADRSGVEIDYCPKCRGVWLDRGELD